MNTRHAPLLSALVLVFAVVPSVWMAQDGITVSITSPKTDAVVQVNPKSPQVTVTIELSKVVAANAVVLAVKPEGQDVYYLQDPPFKSERGLSFRRSVYLGEENNGNNMRFTIVAFIDGSGSAQPKTQVKALPNGVPTSNAVVVRRMNGK